MANRALNYVHIDLFQSVKRGLLHRGIFPDPNKQPDITANKGITGETKSDSEPKKEGPSPTELTGSPEPQEVHEKLIDITEKAQDVLYQADTIFPFTLFPDTITLDREKLTVATRYFFRTAKIISVPISSISTAEIDLGPFFASLHLASKFFVQNKYTVNMLTRKDATEIQQLLQGFIIAQEKNIDVTDIEKDDLCMLLKDLGQGVAT